MIVDLFPPGPRDPQGIHKAIWDEFIDNDFPLPSDRTLTLASYIGGTFPEAFVEPIAVGARCPTCRCFSPRGLHSLAAGSNLSVGMGSRAVILARRSRCAVTARWNSRLRELAGGLELCADLEDLMCRVTSPEAML